MVDTLFLNMHFSRFEGIEAFNRFIKPHVEEMPRTVSPLQLELDRGWVNALVALVVAHVVQMQAKECHDNSPNEKRGRSPVKIVNVMLTKR